MINVVITEDNEVFRNGMEILINATEGMKCVGSYGSCEDLLTELPNMEADIFLQDIELPGMSGIECVPQIRKISSDGVVLMLTVFENDNNIFDALKAGAVGYMLKKVPPAELIKAVKNAYNGGSPMSSSVARKVVSFFSSKRSSNKKIDRILTEREVEIITSLSSGNSYKMIADDLDISIDTVRSHIRKIYKKLQVHNQSEAVAKAIRTGIV